MVYIDDGYILGAIKSGDNDPEYDNIVETVKNKPEAPSGYDYKLTADYTWELYELPPAICEEE